MALKKTVVLIAVLAILFPACKKESEKAVAVAKKAPERPVLVAERVSAGGTQQMKELDPQMAKDVNKALNKLVADEPEQASAKDLAAAKDPGKLLGRWQIVHTVHSTNGKASPPSAPLVPTEWLLEKSGRLAIQGGMKLEMRYVYTGDRLIVTGLGPKQDFMVVKLTDDRLEVALRIEAGTTIIENTTILKRK